MVGPPRDRTQVEVSLGNALVLGLEAPLRESGRLDGTPGVTLVGSAGQVELESGLIAAARHIHMHPRDGGRRTARAGARPRRAGPDLRAGGERAVRPACASGSGGGSHASFCLHAAHLRDPTSSGEALDDLVGAHSNQDDQPDHRELERRGNAQDVNGVI